MRPVMESRLSEKPNSAMHISVSRIDTGMARPMTSVPLILRKNINSIAIARIAP